MNQRHKRYLADVARQLNGIALELNILASQLDASANDDIGHLDISIRAHNALKRAEIHTISQLLAIQSIDGMKKLLSIRCFGEVSLKEVEDALEKYKGNHDPNSD